jgi:hypothetical protein
MIGQKNFNSDAYEEDKHEYERSPKVHQKPPIQTSSKKKQTQDQHSNTHSSMTQDEQEAVE